MVFEFEFDIESLAFCDKVVNGDVVPERVPGVILLSFSRDGKETLFGMDDDIILYLCWGWSIKQNQWTNQ